MKRALVALLFLTLVYALVLGSFAPYDLALGALLSGTLLYGFRSFVFGGRPAPLPRLFRRVLAFGPFAFAVFREVVWGTWEVALVILRLKPLESPGLVKLPIGERTPTGVVVSALVDTLSPGAVLVELDWEEECALIHIIDAADPEAFRRRQEELYQRYQKTWIIHG